MSVGLRIRILRKQQKMTLKALGQKTGLSASFLCDMEKGRTTPSLPRLSAMAAALDTTVGFLMGEDVCQSPLPKSVQETAHTLMQSPWGQELLEHLSDAQDWSESDKQELLQYLRVKKALRNTETGA